MGKDKKTILNASGYPLQIKVKKLFENPELDTWHVLSEEHRWSYANSSGFIDLLAKHRKRETIIVECKRQRKPWLFIVEESQKTDIIKSLIRYKTETGTKHFWWKHLFEPVSYKSQFCVVEGQGVKGQPMLERICDELLLSTEAVLNQEIEYSFPLLSDEMFYFPVIVTNSPLYTCIVDTNNIELKTGELTKLENIETVPFIRFEKPLYSSLSPYENPKRFQKLNEVSTRTVLIINAEQLMKVLKEWRVHFHIYPPNYLGP